MDRVFGLNKNFSGISYSRSTAELDEYTASSPITPRKRSTSTTPFRFTPTAIRAPSTSDFSSLTFHAYAIKSGNEFLYYTATPELENDDIVLNYEEVNPTDKNVQEKVSQLFRTISPVSAPTIHYSKITDTSCTTPTRNTPIADLSRFNVVHITCKASSLSSSEDPLLQELVETIANQCQRHFPSMVVELSSFEVQIAKDSYDATSKLGWKPSDWKKI